MNKPRLRRVQRFGFAGFIAFYYWTWECSSSGGIGHGGTPHKAYDEWVSDVPKNWTSWLWRKALKKIGWR